MSTFIGTIQREDNLDISNPNEDQNLALKHFKNDDNDECSSLASLKYNGSLPRLRPMKVMSKVSQKTTELEKISRKSTRKTYSREKLFKAHNISKTDVKCCNYNNNELNRTIVGIDASSQKIPRATNDYDQVSEIFSSLQTKIICDTGSPNCAPLTFKRSRCARNNKSIKQNKTNRLSKTCLQKISKK
jgi:hypothetical protein